MSIRILIADDHTLFREMLRDTLSTKGKAYDVVGQTADGEQTLNLVTRHHPISCFWTTRCPACTACLPSAKRWRVGAPPPAYSY